MTHTPKHEATDAMGMSEANAQNPLSGKSGELKPCPFCGGSVELEETLDRRQWWGVVCRNTQNRGGTCAIEQRPSASKAAAVERWNRRATTQPAEQSASSPVEGEALRRLEILASDLERKALLDRDDANQKDATPGGASAITGYLFSAIANETAAKRIREIISSARGASQ